MIYLAKILLGKQKSKKYKVQLGMECLEVLMMLKNRCNPQYQIT